MDRLCSVSLAAICLALGSSAHASDEIRYGSAPAWVEVRSLDPSKASGKTIILYDQQVRLEGGTVTTYTDGAIKLTSPEALTNVGTLTAQWMPDKGDLIVHRVELLRNGEIVDLIAGGAKFEVLRREQQLERRIVDGARTATLAVPGARVGDVLRLAYSVTLKDQALGEQMQFTAPLIAKPAPVASGGVRISWPHGAPIRWKVLRDSATDRVRESNGYDYLELDVPRERSPEMPSDAPARFQLPAMIQIGSFGDWRDVSRLMAPLFLPKTAIEPGSDLVGEVATIKAASADPLVRASLATQLVQDKISYLLNGMNGGNYVPQDPEQTWHQRFGDCKAKSLLLLSLLKAMDIEAEPLLVRSTASDAVSELLPMPADFDHVIVRATISGIDYFLDGTSAGTRTSNVDTVPPFIFGLPLRTDGAELLKLPQRAPATSQFAADLTIDSSAGVAVPALYAIDIALAGGIGAQVRALHDQLDRDTAKAMAATLISPVLGDTQPTSTVISYDEASGLAHLRATGLMTTPWKRENEVYRLVPPAQLVDDVAFDADRARAAWKDIPLQLAGPSNRTLKMTVKLPEGRFTTEGSPAVSDSIAGIEVHSSFSLSQSQFELKQTLRSDGGELPPEALADAKRREAILKRQAPVLIAPADTSMTWDYAGKERSRLAPLEAAYAKIIADAASDEKSNAYQNRAGFYSGVGDFSRALNDLDKAIEAEASESLYYRRAALRREVGDLKGALADYRAAEALEAKGNSYAAQIEVLGLLGRPEEGLAIAEDYRDLAKDPSDARRLDATARMWANDRQSALAILQEEVAKRPGDGNLLNGQCWEAGIWNLATENTLDTCNRAVQKSDWSSPALDSRAMVFYRLGRLEEAKADYDAVVKRSPFLFQSRYMRGVVRLALHDAGGAKDIADALRMRPSLKALYAAYGITPQQ